MHPLVGLQLSVVHASWSSQEDEISQKSKKIRGGEGEREEEGGGGGGGGGVKIRGK
jgi:hypothetical protein